MPLTIICMHTQKTGSSQLDPTFSICLTNTSHSGILIMCAAMEAERSWWTFQQSILSSLTGQLLHEDGTRARRKVTDQEWFRPIESIAQLCTDNIRIRWTESAVVAHCAPGIVDAYLHSALQWVGTVHQSNVSSFTAILDSGVKVCAGKHNNSLPYLQDYTFLHTCTYTYKRCIHTYMYTHTHKKTHSFMYICIAITLM